MKINQTSFFVLLFVLSIISCGQKENEHTKNTIYLTDGDFEAKELQHKLIKDISDSLIYPGRVSVVEDYLFVLDFKSHKPIHIMDLKGSSTYLGGFGTKGKGPYEIGAPWNIEPSHSNSFTLVDVVQKKVLEYNIDTLLLKDKPIYERVVNQTGFTQFVKVYGDTIFFDDSYNLKNRLFKNEYYKVQDTTNLEGYGSIPKLVDGDLDEKVLSELATIRMKSNNNMFVFGYMYAPRIELFDYKSRDWKTIISPNELTPTFNKAVKQGLSASKNTLYMYTDIAMTDKYIYALYSEKAALDHTYPQANKIYVFDYDGKPIKRYDLDRNISFFDVKSDSIIYGLSVDVMPELLSFTFK